LRNFPKKILIRKKKGKQHRAKTAFDKLYRNGMLQKRKYNKVRPKFDYRNIKMRMKFKRKIEGNKDF